MEDKLYTGMLNIGVRPTLDSANPVKVIEVHILDYEGYIYDRDIIIYFIKRIRDEQRFSGLESLRTQLMKDEHEIRTFFNPASTSNLEDE